MPPGTPKKPLHERILDAEVRCSRWLADGNEALEAGLTEKAEECYSKSQFWLDRYNLLTNQSDRPAPKR